MSDLVLDGEEEGEAGKTPKQIIHKLKHDLKVVGKWVDDLSARLCDRDAEILKLKAEITALKNESKTNL